VQRREAPPAAANAVVGRRKDSPWIAVLLSVSAASLLLSRHRFIIPWVTVALETWRFSVGDVVAGVTGFIGIKRLLETWDQEHQLVARSKQILRAATGAAGAPARKAKFPWTSVLLSISAASLFLSRRESIVPWVTVALDTWRYSYGDILAMLTGAFGIQLFLEEWLQPGQ
jgi:hypothetical protein